MNASLPPDDFAYCEPVTAPPFGTLHIRRLGPIGRKLGGGIDTPTLCGRSWQGWDVERPVSLADAFDGARHTNPAGRHDVCPVCAERLSEAVR